ncbi:PTS sugar transporter subunit IIA [Amphibacillus sp. Q70]|uniref:PTS sugar transporter subunit IIA n=1 Tax=Amphibacillus sp. Q70 TaxID=3453416 RepID=UPI003F86A3F5
MIKHLLKRENVVIKDWVDNWQEAIYVSTHALVEQGYVTSHYPKAIIKLTEKHGPYYILAPNIALIHALPEDGVVDNQIAVTMLKKPVNFDSDRTAKLLITLAAKNSSDHLNALKKIGELLMDDRKVAMLLRIEDAEELYRKFTE